MMGRPTTARDRARARSAANRNRPKKKKKGMWSMCAPTIATCGVVCCMWMPKLFLIIGSCFSFIGALLLILSSVESLDYPQGKASGGGLLGVGLVLVIVSTIGLFLKKYMKAVPDDDSTEGGLKVVFRTDRREDYEVPERPSSAAPYDPYEMGIPYSSKGGRPKSSAGQRPNTAGGSRPKSSMANGRPVTAGSSRPASAGSSRPGTAASNRLGASGSSRPGLSGSPRPGTAGSSRPGSSTSSRPGSRPSSASRAGSIDKSPRHEKGMRKSSPRSNSCSHLDQSIDEEINYKPNPFVTETSRSMSPALNGHLPGVRTMVEVHKPPVISIVSSDSFHTNTGFEQDVDDMADTLQPGLIGDETIDEIRARSPMPSPRFIRRKTIIAEDIDTESL